jgi:pimeloyl-ACP methyl ester carboxylesterase
VTTNDHFAKTTRRGHQIVLACDGVRLAVTDSRPTRPAAATVVFCHGWCLSQASWGHQIRSLERCYGEDVRVIAFDHRGHGQSAPGPALSYRPEQLADDLAQVLATLDVRGPLLLVGHSLGAMVLLAYLARPALDRPIDPDGLVLVATAAGQIAQRGLGRLLATPGIETLCRAGEHAPQRALRAVAAPVCAALSRRIGCGPSQRATVASVVAAAVTTTPLATALGFVTGLRSFDAYRVLSTIQARTIIITGEADVITPPEHSRDLAAGIAGAELISLPGVGHMVPQQAPDVITGAIASLINTARVNSTVDALAGSLTDAPAVACAAAV